MPSVSKEQIERAKEVGILDYLMAHEPDNIKSQGNGRYILRDHDSFVISRGQWCWNSRGFGCKTATALNYLIKVRGLSFVDAVTTLCRDDCYIRFSPPAQSAPKPFTLPQRSKSNDRAIAYLLSRGIDKAIIDTCVKSGAIYESISKSQIIGRHYYNCAFIGYDLHNKARYACVRAIYGTYRRDMEGSDKRYSFCIPAARPCGGLYVAESPIDALSLATLKKRETSAWSSFHYLSLGGISSKALVRFLTDHPEVSHITLCLDNDGAGQRGAQQIQMEIFERFRDRPLSVYVEIPPIGNDYNDTLQALIKQEKEPKSRSAAISI